MANLKISELTAAGALTGAELVEAVQGGVNVQTTTQDIANLGGGGSGTVESVTGDGVDNTDPNNPVLTFPVASEVEFTPAGNISANTVEAAINELDTEKQKSLITIRTETASHTLDATDLSNVNLGAKLMIRMNLTGTAHNLTVPPNATQAFPTGTEIVVIQTGTGVTTIVQGAGVTITPPAGGNLISPGQGQPMVLVKTGTNAWDLYNGNEAQALTKVDDTNITLTLGGAPTSSLLSAVSLTLGWTGVLATSRGGLGTGTPEGTYTPTLTSVANVAASTAFLTAWYRIGSSVTVFGKVNIDVTAGTTLTELGISLPVASALAAEEDLAGTAAGDAAASLSARIKADVSNARASLTFRSTSLTNDSYAFQFSYLIK